jgi:hypothetical protein
MRQRFNAQWAAMGCCLGWSCLETYYVSRHSARKYLKKSVPRRLKSVCENLRFSNLVPKGRLKVPQDEVLGREAAIDQSRRAVPIRQAQGRLCGTGSFLETCPGLNPGLLSGVPSGLNSRKVGA